MLDSGTNELREWIAQARRMKTWAVSGRARHVALDPRHLATGFASLAADEQSELLQLMCSQPYGAARTAVAAMGFRPDATELHDALRQCWAKKRPQAWVNALDWFVVSATLIGRGLEAAAYAREVYGTEPSHRPVWAAGGPTDVEMRRHLADVAQRTELDDELLECALDALRSWDPLDGRPRAAASVVALLASAGCETFLPSVEDATKRLVHVSRDRGEVPEPFQPPIVARVLADTAVTDRQRRLAEELSRPTTYGLRAA